MYASLLTFNQDKFSLFSNLMSFNCFDQTFKKTVKTFEQYLLSSKNGYEISQFLHKKISPIKYHAVCQSLKNFPKDGTLDDLAPIVIKIDDHDLNCLEANKEFQLAKTVYIYKNAYHRDTVNETLIKLILLLCHLGRLEEALTYANAINYVDDYNRAILAIATKWSTSNPNQAITVAKNLPNELLLKFALGKNKVILQEVEQILREDSYINLTPLYFELAVLHAKEKNYTKALFFAKMTTSWLPSFSTPLDDLVKILIADKKLHEASSLLYNCKEVENLKYQIFKGFIDTCEFGIALEIAKSEKIDRKKYINTLWEAIKDKANDYHFNQIHPNFFHHFYFFFGKELSGNDIKYDLTIIH